MQRLTNFQTADRVVIAVANLLNLVMVPVFLMRTLGVAHLQVVGLLWVVSILVLTVVVMFNIRARRAWWAVVIPSLLGVFLVTEVALDYILRYDFRNTNLLAPYLFLYYTSILGMIGYAFATHKKYGLITLATYFLSQFAALYSYMKVGHR